MQKISCVCFMRYYYKLYMLFCRFHLTMTNFHAKIANFSVRYQWFFYFTLAYFQLTFYHFYCKFTFISIFFNCSGSSYFTLTSYTGKQIRANVRQTCFFKSSFSRYTTIYKVHISIATFNSINISPSQVSQKFLVTINLPFKYKTVIPLTNVQ